MIDSVNEATRRFRRAMQANQEDKSTDQALRMFYRQQAMARRDLATGTDPFAIHALRDSDDSERRRNARIRLSAASGVTAGGLASASAAAAGAAGFSSGLQANLSVSAGNRAAQLGRRGNGNVVDISSSEASDNDWLTADEEHEANQLERSMDGYDEMEKRILMEMMQEEEAIRREQEQMILASAMGSTNNNRQRVPKSLLDRLRETPESGVPATTTSSKKVEKFVGKDDEDVPPNFRWVQVEIE